MNAEEIRFSWLIPVGPATTIPQLEDCLSSVMANLGRDDELVLVRDASPQEFRCMFKRDKDLGLVSCGNRTGAAWPCGVELDRRVVTIDACGVKDCGKALNVGLARCRNPYVIRMDADDFELPGRPDLHAKQILEHPDAVAWGLTLRACDQDGYENPRMKANPLVPEMIRLGGVEQALRAMTVPIPHPASCFSRAALVSVGGWPEDMPRCEDYGLHLRFLSKGMSVVAGTEACGFHRFRREHLPEDVRRRTAELRVQALKRFDKGFDPSSLAGESPRLVDPSVVTIKGKPMLASEPIPWVNKPDETSLDELSDAIQAEKLGPVIAHDAGTGEKIKPAVKPASASSEGDQPRGRRRGGRRDNAGKPGNGTSCKQASPGTP